jgi:hypothetical protein
MNSASGWWFGGGSAGRGARLVSVRVDGLRSLVIAVEHRGGGGPSPCLRPQRTHLLPEIDMRSKTWLPTGTRRPALLGVLTIALAIPGCDTGGRSISPATDAQQGVTADRALVKRLARDYGSEVPLAYYQLSLDFSKSTAGFTPPVQARAYAYMGIALYEALVGGMPDQQSIASQLHGIGALPIARGGPYHWPLVASAALAEVMRGLWGGATNRAAQNVAALDALEAHFVSQYDDAPPGIAKRSIELGHAVGAAVFATSRDDGGDEGYAKNFPATYTPPTGPGLWVPLPGQVAMQPFWGTAVRTFALASASQCNPSGPPAYSEAAGSEFYTQALEVHDLVVNATPEQIAIAKFWADGPGTISGPGHSLSITDQILMQEHADLAVAAQAYARVGIADADAVTALWHVKYAHNLIRPVTYIRQVIDPAFTPRLPTPPFPEYVSAHSGQSAAAMVSLEYLFGPSVAFVDHSHDADGLPARSFDRLSAAAEEAGISRLYAGIHFRSGNVDGQWLGRCVAAKVNALHWRAD